MVDYTEGATYQYHTHLSPDTVGKYVLITGDPNRCAKIASYFTNAKKVAQNREYTTYTGILNDEQISIVSTGIGGPSTAIAIEELVRCGVHTIIRIGTCGGMQLYVEGGDVIIATGAIRMEGTTKEYAPIEFPAVPNFQVTSALIEMAKERKVIYHTGVVECKDSFFGEVDPENSPVGYELMNKWKAWIKCGAIASEMESATLFVLGGIKRIRTGAILLALDNQEREKKKLSNIQVHDISSVIAIAIDAMEKIIEEDRS